jgi:Holliday junction resolvase RusA-like endonuclease
MPIPPSRSKQKDKLINTFHVYTPDLSNMIKFVEDIANGILYKDDCQISSIVAHKIYSDTSRTEFTLSRIDK